MVNQWMWPIPIFHFRKLATMTQARRELRDQKRQKRLGKTKENGRH